MLAALLLTVPVGVRWSVNAATRMPQPDAIVVSVDGQMSFLSLASRRPRSLRVSRRCAERLVRPPVLNAPTYLSGRPKAVAMDDAEAALNRNPVPDTSSYSRVNE